MKTTSSALLRKRQALLGGYLVVYQNKKQRQIYIPLAQRAAIARGVKQYEVLRATVQAITRLNLKLMRQRTLSTSVPRTTAQA